MSCYEVGTLVLIFMELSSQPIMKQQCKVETSAHAKLKFQLRFTPNIIAVNMWIHSPNPPCLPAGLGDCIKGSADMTIRPALCFCIRASYQKPFWILHGNLLYDETRCCVSLVDAVCNNSDCSVPLIGPIWPVHFRLLFLQYLNISVR